MRISKSGSFTTITVMAATLGLLCGCTNPTTTAGTTSSSIDGIITGVESVDIDTQKYDSGSNALIGAVGGAIIGSLINGHSTGAWVGGTAGALAGGFASSAANRTDGVRLTIDTYSGTLVVDEPFSCLYDKGAKVRLISNGSTSQIQVLNNGKYVTAGNDDRAKCPVKFDAIKAGEKSATEQKNSDTPYGAGGSYNNGSQSSGANGANGGNCSNGKI